MRKTAATMLAVLAGCAAPQPASTPQPALELAGRAAGTAQRCVDIRQSEAMRVSQNNRHTILYGSGDTIYANHLGAGCGFGVNDILVTEPLGSSYCRGDIVRSVDQMSRIPGPACVLGDFVPYTRD